MCDAATLISDAKFGQNPESSVGILQMSGTVEVLASPTTDMGKILAVCSDLKIKGKLSFDHGLSVAALALKHRKNKNGVQRIIAFVASPIDNSDASIKKLIKIAKQFKKNSIAVDIVCMGETDHNQAILTQFIDAVSKESNSHLVTVPEGILPSDVLISSPIVYGNEGGSDSSVGGSGAGASGIGGSGGAFAEYGGVDPNLDPALALALRASMEEERARQQEASTKPATTVTSTGTEDDVVKQALLMSMASSDTKSNDASEKVATNDGDGEDDEDAILARALMMSQEDESNKESEIQTTKNESSTTTTTAAASIGSSATSTTEQPSNSQFLDPSFVSQLLADLPGVDVNSPEIQNALQAMKSSASDSSKKKDEDDGEEKNPKKQKKDDDKNT